MIFWAIVLGLVGVVLLIAWRKDRKHKVSINRRSGAVENDIGGGAMYGGDGAGGGYSGPGGL